MGDPIDVGRNVAGESYPPHLNMGHPVHRREDMPTDLRSTTENKNAPICGALDTEIAEEPTPGLF